MPDRLTASEVVIKHPQRIELNATLDRYRAALESGLAHAWRQGFHAGMQPDVSKDSEHAYIWSEEFTRRYMEARPHLATMTATGEGEPPATATPAPGVPNG